MEASAAPQFIAGTTLWLGTNRHPFIIISDPAQNEDVVLCVNLTTYDPNGRPNDADNDPACIIEVGEHPWVEHTTCVCYHRAETPSFQHLEWRHGQGQRMLRIGSRTSAQLLAKIRERSDCSDHIKPIHVDLLREQGLLP